MCAAAAQGEGRPRGQRASVELPRHQPPNWSTDKGSSMCPGAALQAMAQTADASDKPVLAPGQLKHGRTCSLDVEQRDVPRGTLSSSLKLPFGHPHLTGLGYLLVPVTTSPPEGQGTAPTYPH